MKMKKKNKKLLFRITIISLCLLMLLSTIATAFATSYEPIIKANPTMIVQTYVNNEDSNNLEQESNNTKAKLIGVGIFMVGAIGTVTYHSYKEKHNKNIQK